MPKIRVNIAHRLLSPLEIIRPNGVISDAVRHEGPGGPRPSLSINRPTVTPSHIRDAVVYLYQEVKMCLIG